MRTRVYLALFLCMSCAPNSEPSISDSMVYADIPTMDLGRETIPDEGTPAPDIGMDASRPQLVDDALVMAGNAATESLRYQRLLMYRASLDDDSTVAAEMDRLLPYIDRWANGRETYWSPGDQESAGEGGYLSGYFVLNTWPGNDFPAGIGEESPLYPMWCLYRGRMLIWAAIQNGVLVDEFFSEARTLLQIAHGAFPENPVLGMYLDEPIPWVAPFEADPAAPRWANLQREALYKLHSVIEFWIDDRQAEDGQFGGGWGDDVEMWRWWTPLLLGFNIPRFQEAQIRLAENVHALPRMSGGYTDLMTDVEHSSEDSADTIIPLLQLLPKDDDWHGRALRIAELMDTLWLAENELGQRQFQSTYFTSSEVDATPDHACDTPYHARAAAPALLAWHRNEDPELDRILTDWVSTWVDAARREEGNKPGGLFPAAIRYPSGSVGQNNGLWWDPRCHFTPVTFRWPRGFELLSQAFVIAYLKTGNEDFLSPIFFLVSHRDEGNPNAEEGSLAWAIDRLGNKYLTALSKFRLSTEDARFDHVLRGRASAYVRSRITNDINPLEDDLEKLVGALRVDEAAHTEEVRFTDRVYKFHRRYADLYRDEPVGGINMTVLYEMLTGDFGSPNILPLPGVRWTTDPQDIALMVTRNETQHFEAEIFVYGRNARRVEAEFFRLDSGRYRWRLDGDQTTASQGDYIQIEGGDRLSISVPAGRRFILSLTWSPR